MQQQLAHWFIGLQRRNKAVILIGADVVFVLFALWAAFSLRWGEFYIPKAMSGIYLQRHRLSPYLFLHD